MGKHGHVVNRAGVEAAGVALVADTVQRVGHITIKHIDGHINRGRRPPGFLFPAVAAAGDHGGEHKMAVVGVFHVLEIWVETSIEIVDPRIGGDHFPRGDAHQ